MMLGRIVEEKRRHTAGNPGEFLTFRREGFCTRATRVCVCIYIYTLIQQLVHRDVQLKSTYTTGFSFIH